LKRAELIEGMEGRALDVLGKRIFLDEDGCRRIAHDARHRRGFGKALLFHEKGQGSIAAAAGRHFEHAGLGAFGVEHRTRKQALQEAAAPIDVFGEVLDRDAGFDAPNIRLRENQLVERDVAR